MTTKLLLDTLRLADDGKVECKLSSADGSVVSGIIEQSFFEELTVPGMKLTPQRLGVMIKDNIAFLEGQAERQLREGSNQVVIS